MSRLTKQEQETIIRFDEQEPYAEVYTHNKALQKKLAGLCEKYPDRFTYKGNNGAGGETYIVPRKRVTISAPRTLTPEQKEKARQNLLQN